MVGLKTSAMTPVSKRYYFYLCQSKILKSRKSAKVKKNKIKTPQWNKAQKDNEIHTPKENRTTNSFP